MVEKFGGYSDRVFGAQYEINLFVIVGDKEQRTARRDAKLRAEGMVVGVPVLTQKTIPIAKFAANVHRLSWYPISNEKLNVPPLGQTAGLIQIGGQGLNAGEWQAI